MADKKIDFTKFDDIVKDFIDNSLDKKIKILENTKGITVSHTDGSFNVTFDKKVVTEGQDVTGVLLKGGIIMTENGANKKKEGKKLIEGEDYYIVSGIGEKL